MDTEFNKQHEYFDKPNGSYVATTMDIVEDYNRRFDELMKLPKEELVRRLIGDRPMCLV